MLKEVWQETKLLKKVKMNRDPTEWKNLIKTIADKFDNTIGKNKSKVNGKKGDAKRNSSRNMYKTDSYRKTTENASSKLAKNTPGTN